MNRAKLWNSAMVLLGMGTATTGVFCYCKRRKKLRSEFQQICFYMAVLDDEICREELDGMVIGKKTISFPPRRETLYHRYRVFEQMYWDLSKEELETHVAQLEKRLAECKEKGHDEE